MRVKLRQGIPKVRRVFRVWGFGPDTQWKVHNNNKTNLLRGLVERVYCVSTPSGLAPPPRPIPYVFGERLRSVKTQLLRLLPKSAPVDYNTFVEYYKGRQKAVYQRAVDSLMTNPVRPADAQVKTFVKAEKINTTVKPDPAPRLIQPRDPRYNVEVGRFLKPIEKRIYKALGAMWGGVTVLKMNAQAQASALRDMWDSFNKPVAVGLDASRFDQHVSSIALQFEHSIYLRCFTGEDRERLRALLQWQIHNKGKAYAPDCAISYEVDGCRMSGDINTSLGNCLLMCLMVKAYCDEVGIKARLANNGDDCVVIMGSKDLDVFTGALNAWFLDMGFTMKVEAPVYEFEQIEFCQTHPVWTPQGWIMVRNFETAPSKDLISLLNLEQSLEAYLGAVGECGLALTGGLPVYQELYATMMRAGKPGRTIEHGAMAGGLRMLSIGMKREYGPIHPATRVSFSRAFGILPDEQEELEKWLRTHPLSPKLPQTLTPFAPLWYK